MNPYTVKLETFEGPLELLLELIEKEKLDITDISLAKITDEFVGYLSHFQEKDPAHLSDFLVIAAKLILIKSKTLLPSFSVSEEEAQELDELKDKLAEYQRVRAASRHIAKLERARRVAYHRSSALKHIVVFAPPEGVHAQTLRESFARVKQEREAVEHKPLEEERMSPVVSFEEKVKDIKDRLEKNLQESFSALYDANAKINVIVAFLAVLELIKQCFLRAEQTEVFGEIRIEKITQS